MTEKQERILDTALRLFAELGYSATSTSKVAKEAGVSEGLIFRHFQNKEGLLDAIMKLGEDRLKTLFADIVMESDPQQIISKTLGLAKTIASDEYQMNFWRLQYKLKWELEYYNSQKMEPLRIALSNAFSKLNYEDPDKEADIILVLLDGLAMRLFLEENGKIDTMTDFLIEKYKE